MSLKQTYDFLIGDFEDIWNLVTDESADIHRGNYLFACHVATLWRFAFLLGQKGSGGHVLTRALVEINPRYGSLECHRLFEYLSDPLRVYEEEKMKLDSTGVGEIQIALTGAVPESVINRRSAKARKSKKPYPQKHLLLENGTLYVRTDQLFLDVKRAIETSGLLEKINA